MLSIRKISVVSSGSHHLQVPGPQAGYGDRERVGVIGLAAAATTQRADPGREPGRDVEDRLTLGDQPLRQPGTHSAGTLDSPDPVPVGAGEGLHRPVAGPVVGEPLLGQHSLLCVDHDEGVARLVRIDPDDDSRHDPSSVDVDGEEGRATCGEAHPS